MPAYDYGAELMARCFAALDLFCGGGGVSVGLKVAGFEVLGVDIENQPEYPFEFVQGDALEFDLRGFDLVWVSPPCQAFIRSGTVNKAGKPDLLSPMRPLLACSGSLTVIENVPGAPMTPDLILCGSMFGLALRRHRWFELNFQCLAPAACDHSCPVVGVYGNPHGARGAWPSMLPGTMENWREAMGIDWLSARPLSQAIPPAYAEHIGRAAISGLARRAA